MASDAGIAYVDNDPLVLAHARALLTSTPEGRTAYIDGDLPEPEKILASPAVRGTLDFSEPIALMLVSSAATLGQHHQSIVSAQDAAQALRPRARPDRSGRGPHRAGS